VADKGHRMGNVDWTATGTWLLAAITLVYVVVVWRQAVIARDAAKHAEAAAVAAKQSAEAAEAMVQIASGQLAEMRRMTEATLRAAEAASEQARLDRERLAHQRPRIVLLRRRGDPSQVLLMNQGRLSASDAQVALRRAHGAGIGR